MTSPIEAAKSRHSLADVARRTGVHVPANHGNWTVRCPMPAHGHPDRTPSMRLYLDQGLWACFGCSPVKPNGKPRAADVVDWVRATQRLDDWRAAVAVLDAGGPLANAWDGVAGRYQRPARLVSPAGMEYPDLGRTPPERVRAAMDAAWDFYTTPSLHARGVAYLRSRGIEVAVLEACAGRPEVGCSLSGRAADQVIAHMRSEGFGDDELVDAALAHRNPASGALCAAYRDRVLIPVRRAGRLAGFVGRNIGELRGPKYKNPPRTHTYDKSVDIYEPLMVPDNPRGRAVIVEGTLDALAIAVGALRAGKAHVLCPVTQSGRELSASQIRRIIHLQPNPPVIAFDADVAGKDSAFRYSIAFALAGRAALVTSLAEGHDPASWMALHGTAGLSAWTTCEQPGSPIGGADDSVGGLRPIPAAAYVARYVVARYGPSAERLQALRELALLARSLPDPARREWASLMAVAASCPDPAEAQLEGTVPIENRPSRSVPREKCRMTTRKGWVAEPPEITGSHLTAEVPTP